MRNFYKNSSRYIISKIMIIGFSFHRIMVNVLLIMINILFHRKLQYRVKTPSRHNIASIAYFKRSVSFRFVYNFKFFYILKHLKFKLTEENQASVELYPGVLSQLDSDRASKTTTTTLFVPNSKQKYWRVVQAAPNNHRS